MPEPSPSAQAAPDRASQPLRFGRFLLKPLERVLLHDDAPVALGGRAFDLLLELVEHAGALVTRNALIERVWPGLVVEENNLSVQVNALRKALGHAVIVTVPGRGYRFVAAVEPAGAVPAGAMPAPGVRTHLPAVQPLLVGRSDDLAALGTLVDQHRLVTLLGAGGIGKTRLAQALLQLRLATYEQGVCWIDLSGVSDPAALPGAVATALGVQPMPGNPLAGLAQAVAGLRMLVTLDNAEHLVADVAALAEALLAAAPGLRLLVTSQVPLRLAAERLLRLAPLAWPQGPLPAYEAEAFGAVALFVDRAQAADSRFVLADAQVPAVIELCRRLDGLPLAIELAAARLPALGVEHLLASMAQPLRLLTTNRDRHAPPRQQTLRAALLWSHGLLAPREQAVFRRLAVAPDTASLVLLQQLAEDPPGAGPFDEWEVLDALDILVQRSLVELFCGPDASLPRYRLLEAPRALALELLAASGEEQAVRQRHARAVFAELDAAELAMLRGQLGVEAWRRNGEQELDHARAAIAWAREAGESALLLGLVAALLPCLPPPLHDERLALADLCEALIPGTGDARARRRAWSAIGVALGNARPQRSLNAALQALAQARAIGDDDDGDRYALYCALCEAADVVADEHDALRAEALLREARVLEDPLWPPVRLRSGVRLQASIVAARGQAGEALRLYRRLLELGRAAGDPSLMTQVNIADTELWSGDAQAAVRSGQALVAVLARLRDENHLAYARLNLAAACLAVGDTAQALEVLRIAWPAALRIERHAWCADYLALLAALEGRLDAAVRLVGSADRRYAAVQDVRQINEAAARERVMGLALAALPGAEIEARRRAGMGLSDAEVAWLAFDAAA